MKKNVYSVREPVVSGQFYPDDPAELSAMIDGFTPGGSSKVSARGIILPHAGYVYSGKVAVATVSKIIPRPKVVLLGPNHTGRGARFGLWARGSWKTPAGECAVDSGLAAAILSAGRTISEDYDSHSAEHSLEVELPILQHFFHSFTCVPIACQQAGLTQYQAAAEQLFEALRPVREDVLLVASTDLTHYEPDATARTKDRAIIEAMVTMDDEELLARVDAVASSMCGVAPVAIFLACCRKMGARKASVAMYGTSGDASGDFNSVVGYVGVIVQ